MSPDRGGGGVASSRPSVGRGPVASRNQRRVLLRSGGCLGCRGSVEGRTPQIGDGGAYLYTAGAALTPGRCRAHPQGVGAFGAIGDMEWGVICALLHLGCGHTLLWRLPGRGVRRSQSLRRALLRDVGAVAASTRGWWRWRIPTGVSAL